MNPDQRREIRYVLLTAAIVLLGMLMITSPGYRSSGLNTVSDVERHFGWPAEYYADLWKSETGTAPAPGPFSFLLLPPTAMEFSYSDLHFGALGVNLGFVSSIALLLVLLILHADSKKMSSKIQLTMAGLALMAIALYMTADSFYAAL